MRVGSIFFKVRSQPWPDYRVSVMPGSVLIVLCPCHCTAALAVTLTGTFRPMLDLTHVTGRRDLVMPRCGALVFLSTVDVWAIIVAAVATALSALHKADCARIRLDGHPDSVSSADFIPWSPGAWWAVDFQG
ncbi:hypothetical protein NDU88_002667 [Pleurodeles waltl]|uniref:Uncharacterized protein n=1 Tax=Pleurodeles waltl TaxID=8319 RepID=A0AAV7UWD4_PLEWA|nr:hypothetical protein NDU88_002667 [Pleurodeles waltl]